MIPKVIDGLTKIRNNSLITDRHKMDSITELFKRDELKNITSCVINTKGLMHSGMKYDSYDDWSYVINLTHSCKIKGSESLPFNDFQKGLSYYIPHNKHFNFDKRHSFLIGNMVHRESIIPFKNTKIEFNTGLENNWEKNIIYNKYLNIMRGSVMLNIIENKSNKIILNKPNKLDVIELKEDIISIINKKYYEEIFLDILNLKKCNINKEIIESINIYMKLSLYDPSFLIYKTNDYIQNDIMDILYSGNI